MIENANSPAGRIAMLAGAMSGRSANELIGEQEKAGQRQLVNSDRLPAQMDGGREPFEALGFTFGEPDPRNPLFAPATLPAGWTRQAADHDMWSYLLDEHGRRRVSIFYKAAFYDRRATMYLIGVSGYLRDVALTGAPVITDDTWATQAALAQAARECIAEADVRITALTNCGDAEAADTYRAERAKYSAVLAQLDTTPETDRE